MEELVYLDKDKARRAHNNAVSQLFFKSISNPYHAMESKRDNTANLANLDILLINPNAKFEDLGVHYYDAKRMKIIGDNYNQCDEIQYLRERNETLTEFKDRLNETILKYMKLEIDNMRKSNSINSMYITSDKLVKFAQQAALKALVVRRGEEKDPAYKELKDFVTNKKTYIKKLIDTIPNNPKYQDYMEVKRVADKPITIGGHEYSCINNIKGNGFLNVLEGYDIYKRNRMNDVKDEVGQFIRSEERNITKLRKLYKTFTDAEKDYQKAIKKVYGNDYKGEIDNSNTRLAKAFVLKNNAYREYIKLKEADFNIVTNMTRSGSIPLSYYRDRKAQYDNDNYKDIPPLFRSERTISKSDYIKSYFKEEDYKNFSSEEKDVLYNRYKDLSSQLEHNFFSRDYLASRDITPVLAEHIDIANINVDNSILENNVREKILNNKDNNEIQSIRDKYKSIEEYKEGLDKDLTEYLKSYNDSRGNIEDRFGKNELKAVVDVAQRITMEYLLINPNLDKNSDAYKGLVNFVVDGNKYLDSLIEIENSKILASAVVNHLKEDELEDDADELESESEDNIITTTTKKDKVVENDAIKKERLSRNTIFSAVDQSKVRENQLNFKMADTNISDYDINKYGTELFEFENFMNKYQDNYQLPSDVAGNEFLINVELSQANKNVFRLKYQGAGDVAIREAEAKLKSIKERAKNELKGYVKDALAPEDYVKERIRKIDNNDFTTTPVILGEHNIRKEDYLTTTLTGKYYEYNDEQKDKFYNDYINELKIDRRQFFLRNFLIARGINERHVEEEKEEEVVANIRDNESSKESISLDESSVELMNKIKDELDREDEKNELINDNDINTNIKEKVKDTSIIEDPFNIRAVKDEVNRMNKQESDKVLTAWVNSLKDVTMKRLGDIHYQAQGFDEVFKFDTRLKSFDRWMRDNIDKFDEAFNEDLPKVFSEATGKLDYNTQAKFNDEMQDHRDFYKYFDHLKDIKDDYVEKIETIEVKDDIFRDNLKDSIKDTDIMEKDDNRIIDNDDNKIIIK